MNSSVAQTATPVTAKATSSPAAVGVAFRRLAATIKTAMKTLTHPLLGGIYENTDSAISQGHIRP